MTQSFDVFFDLRFNKRLSKNREAGDSKRHHAYYDVTVVSSAGGIHSFISGWLPQAMEAISAWLSADTGLTFLLVIYQAMSAFNPSL